MCKITLPIAFALITCMVMVPAKAQYLPDTAIKRNVQSIEAPLKRLISLEPKTFSYNTQQFRHLSLPTGQQHGFMASQVQDVFPSLVSERQLRYNYGKNFYKDAYISQVDEKALIPVLVAAVKELNQEVERLKAELQAMKRAAR